LLLRRSANDLHRPGGIDAPGGVVEQKDESWVEGAVRETDEEVGITFQPHQLELVFATTKVGFSSQFQKHVSWVWLGFIAEQPEGTDVQLSEEHQGYDWYDIDQALVACAGLTLHVFLTYVREHGIARNLWERSSH